MPTSERNKLLKENFIKTYRKSPEKLQKSINWEGKAIVTKLKLSDQIKNQLTESPTYVTLKDHKENFQSKPSCSLINPSKNEIWKIFKIVFKKTNKKKY